MTNSVERSLDIPTGLGKTAVMAIWLLARAEGATIPRRLVYVVDRRAVVDQASEVANTLREAVACDLKLGASLNLGVRSLPISTLRGQHVDNKQWLEDPSSPAIIVGTIDMIGSRLLFEGYGVSRKMRPYHAGLLGADTLMVLDEAHLVPPFEMLLDAIASNSARVAPCGEEANSIVPQFKLMSLSATGRARSGQPFTLTDNDFKHWIVRQRLEAKKRLHLKQLKAEDDLTPAKLDELLAVSLAEEAWQITERGAKPVRVIVFCNKRKVAEATKKALEQLAKTADQTDIKDRTELFVGGRRVYERETAAARLRELGFIAGSKPPLTKPVFLFATSAGEVGVDLDADHMVSDLVEWERMIQRLGRVNRRGEGDAQVIVLVEPDPKPDKAAKAALAKNPDEREGKDTKIIEAYQRKVEVTRAKRAPFDFLPLNDDKSVNASPGAIQDLKFRASGDEKLRAILDVATTLEPLRPALTRAIVDAWSMTSLKEHTGRPEIGPWLRGWIEDDPPQTTVVWRRYLPSRSQGKVTRKEIEAFFEAAPPHTSEALETETYQVLEWLLARAKAIGKGEVGGQSASPLGGNQVLAYVLSPAGDYRRALKVEDLRFESDDKRMNQDRKEGVWKALAGGTVIVDANVAGLLDGLLNTTEKRLPRTADGLDWLSPIDGEPVVKFRIRAIDSEVGGDHLPTPPQWRTRLRFATASTEEGEASRWLIVEKWRSDSATEEDRAVGHCQLLEDHQKLAESRARELAKRLNLPEPYAEMFAIAARLHDEGKRATRWQRAFNAPTPGVYAKTLGPINFALLDGYRHEFSSLEIAARDAELLRLPRELQDLALHLIAAHHGFGRPIIGISGCEDAPPSKLETRAREVAVRFARLQQHWGPWGLAWWESLLRAIDHQASRENDAAETDSVQEAVQ
jgi:CRISPR-associated endonuclease/helicase Cas3